MNWKHVAIGVGVGVVTYFVAGAATAAWIASVGDARVSQGLPVYKGGLLSTVVLWPAALIASSGGSAS